MPRMGRHSPCAARPSPLMKGWARIYTEGGWEVDTGLGRGSSMRIDCTAAAFAEISGQRVRRECSSSRRCQRRSYAGVVENRPPTTAAQNSGMRLPRVSRKQRPRAHQPKKPARVRPQPRKTARKIIYDARIELVVDSLTATEQAILRIIKENDGFLAESDQTSAQQNQRHATWRVRVPVANFEAFVGAVVKLGEVQRNHVGSQDVTEEYLDLDARIRNKREEEKRLLKHLADSTGKLEDILAVERELSRVRGEAEQMEGRLRFLADRADLSTVTIEANEWKDFKPPVAASFGTQISRTFFNSVERLVEFGKGFSIVVVALLPWIPLMLIGLVLARWLIRYASRSARQTPAQPEPLLAPQPEARDLLSVCRKSQRIRQRRPLSRVLGAE